MKALYWTEPQKLDRKNLTFGFFMKLTYAYKVRVYELRKQEGNHLKWYVNLRIQRYR